MSKTVKMFARIGQEVIPLGTCHPAQARVLVKKDLAAWHDGDLQVLVRPAFAEILDRNPHAWEGPLDDGNVSKAEVDRRMAWFKKVMQVGVTAASADAPGSQFDWISEQTRQHIQTALATWGGVPEGPEGMLESEVAEFFLPSGAASGTDPDLTQVWDTDELLDQTEALQFLGAVERGVPAEFKVRLPNWIPWKGNLEAGVVLLPRRFQQIH